MGLAKTVTKVFPRGAGTSVYVGMHLQLTDDDREDLGSGAQVVIDKDFTTRYAKGQDMTLEAKTDVGNQMQASIDSYKENRTMFVSGAYDTARNQIDGGLSI